MTRKLRRQGCGTRPALRRAFVVGLSLSMALGGVPAYALEDAAGADGAGTDEQAGASAWQGDDLVSGNADGMAALGIDETIDEGSAVDSVKSDGGEDAIGAADPAATKKTAAVGLRSEYSIKPIGNKTYTGSAIEPKPEIIMQDITESGGERRVIATYVLEEGVEYTLEYKNNVNVGTATVSAIDRIGRTLAEATFQIVEANVSQAKIAKVQKQAYTGKEVKPAPKVTYKGKTLKKGTDYTLSYKNNKKAGTATIIIRGKGNFKGTKKATFKIVAATVSYAVRGQGYGQQAARKNGAIAGKTGTSKRLEALKVSLPGTRVSGSIKYRAYVQGTGWQGWRKAGKKAGTSGKRMEAVKIKLTGKMAKTYDVWYRVHAQNFGWMGWAKNGAAAGTTGYSYRLEAIQIVLRPKGSKAPAASFKGAKRHTKAKFKKNDGTIAGRTYETADFKITVPASWAGKWKLEKVEKNVRFGNVDKWGTRYMFNSRAQGRAFVYVGNAGAKRFSARTQTTLGDFPEIGVSSRGRAVNGSWTPFFGYVSTSASGDVMYLSDTNSSGFYHVGAHAYITVK